jgi:hypothetical protein
VSWLRKGAGPCACLATAGWRPTSCPGSTSKIPEVRETVAAVADKLAAGKEEVMQADIQKLLKLDKSVVSRRVAASVEAGVLRNLENRKGRPARLVLGEPLPKEIELLPKPERLHGCMVADEDAVAFYHQGPADEPSR